jgi:hypothetical protein
MDQHTRGRLEHVVLERENIGCCPGWNRLVKVLDPETYDVVVCFDNDCELIQPDTLSVVAGVAFRSGQIVSPHVLGLRNPPPTIGKHTVDWLSISETAILGNIFMAIPAKLLLDFRWDERHPVWAGGESVTAWHRSRGGWCGYVDGYQCWHYETTVGQARRFPEYYHRRILEGGPAL